MVPDNKYVKHKNNNGKDFIKLSNYIGNVLMEDNNVMVSLDVLSLVTFFPIVDLSESTSRKLSSSSCFSLNNHLGHFNSQF